MVSNRSDIVKASHSVERRFSFKDLFSDEFVVFLVVFAQVGLLNVKRETWREGETSIFLFEPETFLLESALN